MRGHYIPLRELFLAMRYVHTFWCPVGQHYGVIVEDTPVCPMECNR